MDLLETSNHIEEVALPPEISEFTKQLQKTISMKVFNLVYDIEMKRTIWPNIVDSLCLIPGLSRMGFILDNDINKQEKVILMPPNHFIQENQLGDKIHLIDHSKGKMSGQILLNEEPAIFDLIIASRETFFKFISLELPKIIINRVKVIILFSSSTSSFIKPRISILEKGRFKRTLDIPRESKRITKLNYIKYMSESCPVCFDLFGEAKRPFVLNCGHCICEECYSNMIKSSKSSFIQCCYCRKDKANTHLSKNYICYDKLVPVLENIQQYYSGEHIHLFYDSNQVRKKLSKRLPSEKFSYYSHDDLSSISLSSQSFVVCVAIVIKKNRIKPIIEAINDNYCVFICFH